MNKVWDYLLNTLYVFNALVMWLLGVEVIVGIMIADLAVSAIAMCGFFFGGILFLILIASDPCIMRRPLFS